MGAQSLYNAKHITPGHYLTPDNRIKYEIGPCDDAGKSQLSMIWVLVQPYFRMEFESRQEV